MAAIRNYERASVSPNARSNASGDEDWRLNSWPCTNAKGLLIARDPLLTREASITPIFTPISWLRRAADGVEMIRRAT